MLSKTVDLNKPSTIIANILFSKAVVECQGGIDSQWRQANP